MFGVIIIAFPLISGKELGEFGILIAVMVNLSSSQCTCPLECDFAASPLKRQSLRSYTWNVAE